MKKLIFFLVLVVLATTHAHAENMFAGDGATATDYAFEFATGGNDDCLDSVDGNNLDGNEVAFIFRDVGGYRQLCVYWYNFGTSTAEEDPYYVRPDNNATGTWELSNDPGNIGTSAPSSPFDWSGWRDTSE